MNHDTDITCPTCQPRRRPGTTNRWAHCPTCQRWWLLLSRLVTSPTWPLPTLDIQIRATGTDPLTPTERTAVEDLRRTGDLSDPDINAVMDTLDRIAPPPT